ncbi:hypothetical protein WICPIJ_009093 [Wickerhamomyces pijperi]|uniref:Uncharacterized protein n=2 Tax=Saccharomycotina TaxID=147537 RepID=A0A9P8T5W3_9ASCO|nr:uncharacterized protein OGAPHI_003077 [Ogataea philodendri]KAH3667428.1 hypothetical protein OGAPHI_003077 [Ogataea philodendri]KAH3676481.1 hypothetical protein WICPIJ_009093 [Wickerhamomyces pijperi]
MKSQFIFLGVFGELAFQRSNLLVMSWYQSSRSLNLRGSSLLSYRIPCTSDWSSLILNIDKATALYVGMVLVLVE